jgi:hypothetical protein
VQKFDFLNQRASTALGSENMVNKPVMMPKTTSQKLQPDSQIKTAIGCILALS